MSSDGKEKSTFDGSFLPVEMAGPQNCSSPDVDHPSKLTAAELTRFTADAAGRSPVEQSDEEDSEEEPAQQWKYVYE